MFGAHSFQLCEDLQFKVLILGCGLNNQIRAGSTFGHISKALDVTKGSVLVRLRDLFLGHHPVQILGNGGHTLVERCLSNINQRNLES